MALARWFPERLAHPPAPRFFRPPREERPALTSMLGLLLAFFGGISCGSDFDARSRIRDLRVLAISAAPPWVGPGEATRIEPLLVRGDNPPEVDPCPECRFSWSWCPLLGPNSEEFRCLVTPELINGVLASEGSELRVEDDFFELGAERTAELRFAFPPSLVEDVCLALQEAEFSALITRPACNGSLRVTVRVDVSDGGPTRTVFKDVRLVYDPSRVGRFNAIPEVDGLGITVQLGDRPVTGPLAANRAYRLALGTDPGDGPARSGQIARLSETYTATRTITGAGGVSEQETFETGEILILSWFGAEGEFDADRQGFLPGTTRSPDRPDGPTVEEAWATATENVWRTPLPADFPGGQTTIYVVVRDDRLGTSWTSTTVTIEGNR